MIRLLLPTSVIFLIGTLAFSDVKNPLNENDGFRVITCPASEQYPRHSEGDILELKDGTLLFAWSRFTGREDHASAVIAAKTSSDGGKTWGEEYVLQESIGKQNVMSVSFLRLQSSKILFFFLVKNGDNDLQVYVRSSIDEAKTWSEPHPVSTDPGYHVMNNARTIQLSGGRILAPVALSPDIGKQYGNQSCVVYLSDNDGNTWRKTNETVAISGSAAMEPGLVERADGSLLMIIRTHLDRIYRSVSSDQGETWSKAEAMNLIAPESPSTIERIPKSDDMVLIWNNNPLGNKAGLKSRTPLTVAISRDGGNTWFHIKNLEDDPDGCYAYTSLTWVKDRALLSYYEYKGGENQRNLIDLIVRSIPIRWLYE